METTTNPVHEKVSAYVETLIESAEQVRAKNHPRFSSIYNAVHTIVKGEDAYEIKIRRAYNRFNKIATQDDHPVYYASTIAMHIMSELDPTYEVM